MCKKYEPVHFTFGVGFGGAWWEKHVSVESCCRYFCCIKKRCLEDKCFLKCSEPSLSQVNFVVPFLGWLTECCLDTMPALFGWILDFCRKEHSWVGLDFGVYSAEPVKPFFDLGLDGCKISTRVVTELMPFTTVHVCPVFAVKSKM